MRSMAVAALFERIDEMKAEFTKVLAPMDIHGNEYRGRASLYPLSHYETECCVFIEGRELRARVRTDPMEAQRFGEFDDFRYAVKRQCAREAVYLLAHDLFGPLGVSGLL